MKITLPKDAMSGTTTVVAGDYWVSLNAESGEMTLSKSGKDIRVKATRRKSKTNSKSTSVQFYSGGGRTWSLVMSVPKSGEWIAFLEYTT